jgi:hypothetical protein
MSSWKTGIHYQTYISKWVQYCCERHISSISVTIVDVIDFFTGLFQSGLGYSALNTARGALSALGHHIQML